MKKQNIRTLVLTAMFAAIIIVFTLVPYTGYITYGFALEITTLHVFVILGATVLKVKGGLILGTVWGITNMLRAMTNPLWAPFVNPLVSVVPRILVGLVAALVFIGVQKAFKKREERAKTVAVSESGKTPKAPKKYTADTVSCIAAAVAGTFTNTLLVTLAYNFFAAKMEVYKAIYESLGMVINTVISLNFCIETALAVIVTPIIYIALKKAVLSRSQN